MGNDGSNDPKRDLVGVLLKLEEHNQRQWRVQEASSLCIVDSFETTEDFHRCNMALRRATWRDVAIKIEIMLSTSLSIAPIGQKFKPNHVLSI